MKIRFASVAETELKEAVEFYEGVENGLGGELLNEIESAIQRIALHPSAWTQMSQRTRRCRTHRFHSVFFIR